MKYSLKLISIFILLSSFTVVRGQQSPTYIEIKRENGSEAAKEVMISDFYYDLLDNWSPFGNDTGNDTFYLYSDWKKVHFGKNTKAFLIQEMKEMDYADFDLTMNGKDAEKLHSVVDRMRNQYIDLSSIDNMVISLAFSQLFIDGKIEPEVMKLAEAAFEREEIYLNFWDDQKSERKKRMDQLRVDLRKGFNFKTMKIYDMKATGDKEIDKLIHSLKKSMEDYMHEAKPSYNQKDINECALILEDYVMKIFKTHSKEEAMQIVKATVLKLNALNEKCDHSLIETDEREQIVEIIVLSGHKMKYNSMEEDITEKWREW